VANNRVALSELSSHYPGALIVMEAGCHSPWVSRHLEVIRPPLKRHLLRHVLRRKG
jgi:hypothetical protein